MIKIIVDDGKCTLSWGDGDLLERVKEVADGACVAIEEMSSRAGIEPGITERELFYQIFVDRVRQNRVTGTIGEDYAEQGGKNDD